MMSIKKIIKSEQQKKQDGLASRQMQGLRLKMFVRQAGWTMTQLAKKLGLSYTSMKRIVAGKKEIDNDTLVKLEKISNINAEWLMTGRLHPAKPMFLERRKNEHNGNTR
jgi:transcriptional regulator with XRE-family HTH domain